MSLALKDLQDRMDWWIYFDTKPEDKMAPFYFAFAKNPWINRWAIIEVDGLDGNEKVIAEHTRASALLDKYNQLGE